MDPSSRNPSASASNELSRQLTSDDTLMALREWHRDGSTPSPLAKLDLFRQIRDQQNCSDRQATNRTLELGLEQLAGENSAAAALLRQRFLDGMGVAETANSLNIAESTLHIRQRDAVRQLTDILTNLDAESRTQHATDLLQHVPPLPDSTLIGTDAHVNHLMPLILQDQAPWILSLEGIGGIGKTTLAQTLVHKTVFTDPAWDRVAWVTAKQTELQLDGNLLEHEEVAPTAEALLAQLFDQLLPDRPQPASFDEAATATLESVLQSLKCLVVVDNLETVEDTNQLLPLLERLANPTHFVLTSRHSFHHISDIYHFRVPALNEADTIRLVRQTATTTNLPHVVSASDEDLRPIYETVGGNPLAVKLLVGQLHVHGLADLVHDLKEAKGETVENLYTYVYRQAWNNLRETERTLLVAMILVGDEGESIAELTQWSELEADEVRRALNTLTLMNLVESRGGLNERRFSIHNLTRTFLHKQVVSWQ